MHLELIPDSSNLSDDPAHHDFSWIVSNFTESSMGIKVTFAYHEYISAGTSRDVMKATIKQSNWFVSKETFSSILEDSSSSIKVPRTLPDNQSTESLLLSLDWIKHATNSLLVGNAVVNFFIQDTLTMIWGFLNSLQIISHFPLVFVAMPANAHIVFLTIIEIGNF